MNIHVQTDDALTIDRILRPISQAHRILRDHLASDDMPARIGDDPPGADAIGKAIAVVREALATTATPDTVKPLIALMAAAEPDKLMPYDKMSSGIPLAAIASATGKYRGDPELCKEKFGRACIKAHDDMLELLERLKQAQASMRPAFGWRR